MDFCRDEEQPDFFWVDRGIDDKVDHFRPCYDCSIELGRQEPEGDPWFGFDKLCYDCGPRLVNEAEIQEANEERPYIRY